MIYVLQDKSGYYYAGASYHQLPPAYQHTLYTGDWRSAKRYWTRAGCKYVLDEVIHIAHRQNFTINSMPHILLREMKKYITNKWGKFLWKVKQK